MPLPEGTRFRVKKTSSGKKIRLAFKGGTNEVIETKNMESGATHTPSEFKSEMKRRMAKKGK